MSIAIQKLSETASTITLGWTPVSGCLGYRFSSSSTSKPSVTWDPSRSSVKFSKADWYKVEALEVRDSGQYPAAPAPPSSLPAVITAGGTYSGTLTGGLVIQTSQQVTIQDSTITRTDKGDLIQATAGSAKLVLDHVTLNGGTGRAVYATGFDSVVLTNCTINKTWGVRLDNGHLGCTIKILRCKFRNQLYDGTNPSGVAHSIQPAWCQVSAGNPAEIGWNEIINDFGASQTEDVINLYSTPYVVVHDNLVKGAYPKTLGDGYSGGGIICDGPNSNYCEFYGNIVVDTMNYCLAIAGGHDNFVHDNYAVCDQRNDSGAVFSGSSSSGIGMYISDYSSSPSFANNLMQAQPGRRAEQVGWP